MEEENDQTRSYFFSFIHSANRESGKQLLTRKGING